MDNRPFNCDDGFRDDKVSSIPKIYSNALRYALEKRQKSLTLVLLLKLSHEILCLNMIQNPTIVLIDYTIDKSFPMAKI